MNLYHIPDIPRARSVYRTRMHRQDEGQHSPSEEFLRFSRLRSDAALRSQAQKQMGCPRRHWVLPDNSACRSLRRKEGTAQALNCLWDQAALPIGQIIA
jgi:hypothetical protein